MKATFFHRGFLLLAGLLLCLHSLVPHVHGPVRNSSGEETVESIPSSDGTLLGLLQDFVTDTDLGEDHLEHFSADHDVTLDFEITSFSPLALLPTVVSASLKEAAPICRQRAFRGQLIPPSGIYPDTASPRGPPAFV